MNKSFLVVLVLLISCFDTPDVLAAVRGQDVVYLSGERSFKGYLAYDEAVEAERPGVIVVHEWWGQNEYARQRADMLAELGYVAFALDMFGGGTVTDHPDEASRYASEVYADMGEAEERFLSGMRVLQEFPLTDKTKIAAVGYCFGGGIVLQMAREGVEGLDAVVSFHGSLSAKRTADPGDVTARILVVTGAADPMVPAEQVEGFRQEMDSAGADYRVISYDGATHSFTNPKADETAREFGLPVAYNADADHGSWEEMKKFLEEVFLSGK